MKQTVTAKLTAAIVCVMILISMLSGMVLANPLDYQSKAQTLYNLGLFLGTDNGFELERVGTRVEAAAMMVRMLGKEETAKANVGEIPFADVPDWAVPYVSYLYHNGITKGMSDTEFGAALNITPDQYLTYILRSLGYDDAAGDFSWDNAVSKAAELNVLTDEESTLFSASQDMPRGYIVGASYNSLFTNLKNSDKVLLEKLYSDDKAIAMDKIVAASGDENVSQVAVKLELLEDPDKEYTAVEISAEAAKSVFFIEVFGKDGSKPKGYASGFFIDESGIAVTNFHVIRGIYSASITMTDGTKHKVEKVVGYDTNKDIAILKIEGSGFNALQLGDSSKVVSGEKIYAIGNPQGLENTISEGIVSSANRNISGQRFIQITAPISPGSSGGALFNDKCEVVGITTGGITSGQNLNLAVPANEIKLVDQSASKTIVEVSEECGYIGTTALPSKVSDYAANKGAPDFGSVTSSEQLDCNVETLETIIVTDYVYKLNEEKLEQYINYITRKGYRLVKADNGVTDVYYRHYSEPQIRFEKDQSRSELHVKVMKFK